VPVYLLLIVELSGLGDWRISAGLRPRPTPKFVFLASGHWCLARILQNGSIRIQEEKAHLVRAVAGAESLAKLYSA
jgi:hypothetical protein